MTCLHLGCRCRSPGGCPKNDDQTASGPHRKDRFQPGNKHGWGRPEGSRDKSDPLLEKIRSDDAKGPVKMVIERAMQGDMQAARLILDRIVPPRRGRRVQLELPPVEILQDVVVAHSVIIKAMGGGERTLEEAATVAGVLEAKRKAIEITQLEARLSRLEERAKQRG
jgi:hypothetical protein